MIKTVFHITFFVLLGFSAMGQSCSVEGVFHYSFDDIRQILDDNNCMSCHTSSNQESNWHYDTYQAFIRKGDCDKEILVHGNASQSYIYERLSNNPNICGNTADGNHSISSADLEKLEAWINFGAPEDCLAVYQDIRSIFDINGCNSCHGTDAQSWRYDSYNELIGLGTDSNCDNLINVIPQNANASFLYDKINNDNSLQCGDAMNGNLGPLSSKDIATIRDWINGGAPENASTLPVDLSSFDVQNSTGGNILEWTTENEIYTQEFIIERCGADRNFTPIASLPASGNSNTSISYQYIDENPIFGENYYRLRILDADGSYDYSLIRYVIVENTEEVFNVYPNPASSSEKLKVQWLPTIEQATGKLSIIDMKGEYVYRKIIFKGTNYVRLPLLVDGIYYVSIINHFGESQLRRIVILN